MKHGQPPGGLTAEFTAISSSDREARRVSGVEGRRYLGTVEILAPPPPPPPPKLEDHPLSAVCECLVNIFTATIQIRRPSLPSANRGRICLHITYKILTCRSSEQRQMLKHYQEHKIQNEHKGYQYLSNYHWYQGFWIRWILKCYYKSEVQIFCKDNYKSKSHSRCSEVQIKIGKYLLLFISEPYILPSLTQNLQNCNFTCCFLWEWNLVEKNMNWGCLRTGCWGWKREQVKGWWKNVHNEELYNLHSSPNSINDQINEVKMGGACSRRWKIMKNFSRKTES